MEGVCKTVRIMEKQALTIKPSALSEKCAKVLGPFPRELKKGETEERKRNSLKN